MEPTKHQSSPLSWADTPWTVAALLGVWGAMIGIEEFYLANVFMALAAISVAIRLGRDTLWRIPRRIPMFIFGLLVVCSIVGGDVHLTAKKKAASEAKTKAIEDKSKENSDLLAKIADLSSKQSVAQGKSDQKLSDIGNENSGLKKSIEKKDAALVSIAKSQYALNFFPQVYVATNDSLDEIKVTNNGKTNVEVYGYKIQDQPQKSEANHLLVVPGASTGYKITDEGKRNILQTAASQNKETVPIESVVYLKTLDEQQYELGFTWFFIVKDGAITKSYAVDHPIVKASWPMPQ